VFFPNIDLQCEQLLLLDGLKAHVAEPVRMLLKNRCNTYVHFYPPNKTDLVQVEYIYITRSFFL